MAECMANPLPARAESKTLFELKARMERTREQYESAKMEYLRVFADDEKFGATPLTGNVRRIAHTYSCCLERYRQAAIDFHQELLDQTFSKTKSSSTTA